MENLLKNKAEQLAEEARKKAAKLRAEASEKARKLIGQTSEKIANGKKEIAKTGRLATEKFVSEAAMAFGSIAINDALDLAIKKEETNGNSRSYRRTEYNQFADDIEHSTSGAGTNISTINQIFAKLKNNADVLQLMKTYGQRPSSFFGEPIGNETLSQFIVSQLSLSERIKLNSMLTKKGITITF